MKSTIEISGVEPARVSKLSYTERTYGIDTWNAELKKIITIADLATMEIKRGTTSMLTGRVTSPNKGFSSAGSSMPISGWGYAGNLQRFRTGSGTITNKTVTDGLQEILDNSPSVHGITLGTVDTFYFSSAPNEYKTTVEFLKWTYSDTGIEFDPADTEVGAKRPDGANNNILPGGWLRNCFVDIRGRIFIFWTDGTNNVKFNTSTDGGVTWSGVTDTTYNANASGIIDITYDPDDDHVHMAIYTGTVTAIYTGTITGAAIAWVNDNVSIFAANQSPRCSIIHGNEDDHLWTIDTNNHLWESVDDGANWTDHGALTETGKFALPKTIGDAGDTYLLEYDAVNDVLELWWWDDSTTTEAKVKDLYDFGALGDIMEYLTASLGHDGSIHIHCNDDGNNVLYILIETDETVTVAKTAVAGLSNESLTIFTDNADSAYVLYNYPGSGTIKKYKNGALISTTSGFGTSGANQQSPIKSKAGGNDQTGFIMEGGAVGAASIIDMDLLGPTGIRLSRGHTTGTAETDTKSGTGSFERWGLLNALEVYSADLTYDVEDNVGVDLVTGLKVMADLHAEGVPVTETDIQIEINFSKSGATEPYLQELYLSERVDEIETLAYNYEDFNAFLKKLVKYCGAAEYDLSTSDVLTFVSALGTDRSSLITLEQGVNCKKILVEEDWRSYANVIYVEGNGVAVTVKDSSEITAKGEWWAVIRDLDITTTGMAFNRGATALPILSAVVKRIKVDFLDKYNSGLLHRGDTVNVVHPKTGLDQSARFVDLTRTWQKGENVSGNLLNAQRVDSVFDYLAEIESIKRHL